MRRHILRAAAALLALCWTAPMVVAQERLAVRAGEHSGFSRIAISARNLGEWSVQRDGRDLVVDFPDADYVFSTNQISPQRRVSRILSAEGGATGRGGSRLRLALSCDCAVAASRFQRSMLVIDVSDGEPVTTQTGGRADGGDLDTVLATAPAQGDGAGEASAPEPAASLAALAEAAGSGLRIRDPGRADLAALLAEAEDVARRFAPPEPAAEPEPAPSSPAARAAAAEDDAARARADAAREAETRIAQAPEPVETPEPVSIEEAQRRLLEQLARAADQGLVTFREPDPEAGRDRAEAEPSGAEPGGEAETAGDTAPVEAPPSEDLAAAAPDPEDAQLRARTVFDAAAEDRPVREAPPHVDCIEDDRLAVKDWADEDAPVDQMSRLRRELVGEFDRPDAGVATALARLHIRFGFGAEAELDLRAFGAEIKDRALLVDLARVVDDRPPEPDGPLARAAGCPGGAVAMWRAAAGLDAEDGPVDAETFQAMRGALSETPTILRRLLGPRIGLALLDRGAVAEAEDIILLVERAAGDPGPEHRLLRGRLAAAEGDWRTAEAIYRELIDENAVDAPEAMIRLVDSLLARGAPVPEDLAFDLATAARENRGASVGSALRVAEVRAKAGSGGAPEALAIAAERIRATPSLAPQYEDAARAIFEELRADALGPSRYARTALDYLDLVGEDAGGDPARIATARELTQIGLANGALEALAPPLTRRDPDARRAAAQAWLARGEGALALAALGDLQDPAAVRLRAEAEAREGAYAAALAALESVPGASEEERAALAWRAGEWTAATRAGAPDRRAMAIWMAGATGDTGANALEGPQADFTQRLEPDDPPTLGGARQLVERSRGARDLIKEALSDG